VDNEYEPIAGQRRDTDEAPPVPVRVPHEQLRPDTLRELIEHFVTREGTDYGVREYSLDEKCAHVLRQLQSGKAFITFDPASESCTIVLS
jgi:uncharacterized protein YheU (UPF0270 family)